MVVVATVTLQEILVEVDGMGVVSESSSMGFVVGWWWWRVLDWCCGLAGGCLCSVGMRWGTFRDVSV